MDLDKKLHQLQDRLSYITDIVDDVKSEHVRSLQNKLNELLLREKYLNPSEQIEAVEAVENFFAFVESKLEEGLTPMAKVRITRHAQRICLRDILENVYDNYTEIGGKDESSIDPSMLIARAYITRRNGKKVYHQPVLVIGQEKGHGEEFRNGGSVKPWGNAKALQYMRVAETENIPIHTYVFTPGSYPIEDAPGAAQQIAKNIYEMAGLSVPVVSVYAEGGSGGAEAIGLGDIRLMLSHGYYSVISPEGAAAIEGRLRDGKRASYGLIEQCATQMCITAQDNKRMGYIDRIVQEPDLGARPFHFDFFRQLRHEVIRATDEVVISARGFAPFRAMALRRLRVKPAEKDNLDGVYLRWSLSKKARQTLVRHRQNKFRKLSTNAYRDRRAFSQRLWATMHDSGWDVYSYFKYDLWRKHQQQLVYAVEDVDAEARVLVERFFRPFRKLKQAIPLAKNVDDKEKELTSLSQWDANSDRNAEWRYVSPRALEDRTITCPNAATHGCRDLWAPDLYGDFAGVCSNCGHHFPMEYQWFIHNVFDPASVFEFNNEIEAANPLGLPGFDEKLEAAKKKTGQKSSCITFEARIDNIKVVCAVLTAPFRGGSVGAAEGEKFIRAAERARKKRFPFFAYVHGTAGIRIQEGTNGLIQMSRCTIAVRQYIEAGGLYLVLYDTNSYAGPLASFLGCSPYQFAIRSSNIGFAGSGVIKETTGIDIPPHYHNAFKALSRGHIQGIWDRREAQQNLRRALLTMGGRNLYYR